MGTLMKKIIGCVFFSVLASACSWHLRGTEEMPHNLSQLYIFADDSKGAMATELRQLLKANHVALLDNSTDANYMLLVHEETKDKRTAGVGNDALSSAYELTLKADYEIRVKNSELITKATASSVRNFNYNAASISSATQEEALLVKEMHRDLAQQMLRRLNAVIAHPPTTSSESTDGKTAP